MSCKKDAGDVPQTERQITDDGGASGTVTLEMPSGDVYEGTVVDGKPHGRGRMKYQDGRVYEGEWQNGKRHGTGKWWHSNGDVYEGGWKDGKYHGAGMYKDANGSVYDGGWKDGKQCGTGTCKYADGDVYEGGWQNGKEHGNGKKSYANGNGYVGGWKDGKRHGMGTIRWKCGDEYVGEFKEGVRHGKGTGTYADGGAYVGGWKNDKKHGTGTCKYASGGVYEGEWMDNKKCGRGTYKVANGYIYEGGWRDNKPYGFGTYTYADGTVEEGWWNNGTRIWPTPPKERIADALASILLKDEATVDGIDGKFVSYLTELLHGSNLAQNMDHSMEDILRPWLKGFSFGDNLSKECSDAVMECAKKSAGDGTNDQTHAPTDKVMFVNVVDEDSDTNERYALLWSSPFETFLKNYATCKNVSVRRIEHNGSTLFLSAIGKFSPMALGLKNGDDIKVVAMSTKATFAEEKKENTPKHQPRKGKKKKHRKSNRKKSMPIVPPESEEEKWKTVHSQALSIVFEEADLQLREIRQRLAAMNLQRTMPKQRTSQPKEEPMADVVDNPPADGLGGKAGKSFFIVQVGEATNLYNTRAKQSSGRIAQEIDLHGCTKEEALAKLDESLAEWIDAAMKGEYPWVIAVRIVCGGGSQTLAEAVEGWIKRNPNVSNAPKYLYS